MEWNEYEDCGLNLKTEKTWGENKNHFLKTRSLCGNVYEITRNQVQQETFLIFLQVKFKD